MTDPIVLRGGGVSVVVGLDQGIPAIVHWGADLGARSDAMTGASEPVPHSAFEAVQRLELVPQGSRGWRGRPALTGHRADGMAYSPNLVGAGHRALGEGGVEFRLVDEVAELALTVELHLSDDGMLRTRGTVQNLGESAYRVLGLVIPLPVGMAGVEILDLAGRWCREQHPQRQSVQQGIWSREYRHGRTGHDSSLFTAVGSPGFGNRAGSVWATHLGFSGNHHTYVEKTPLGPAIIGSGELLAPGEIELSAGAEYSSPWTYAAFSADGIDGITAVFHRWMRARVGHPASPRPVVLNTWEAVYFSHDLPTLVELAESASDVGVERFVLDDGWFRGRRNDQAGLGDWFVDETVWPDGLAPLIDRVHELGMEFGLWVEPEMVNADSDVVREHPDWISGPAGRTPIEWRSQQVLDLVNPDAFEYIFDRLDALLTENDIAYLKWDQNRDQLELGHGGAASTHAQTLAAYRLFDRLRAAHPDVEIESCSSGGARVDLGILERTDRVWASDCNDALERQTIQRWTQAILPPELVGTHVGPTRSHTTDRVHSLSFRAITALFGHFGVEWDIRSLDGRDRAELAEVIRLYREHRGVLHSGVAVHADIPDPAYSLYGIVAADESLGLYAFVSVATSAQEVPGRMPLPGLDSASTYRVEVVFPVVDPPYLSRTQAGWVDDGIELTGAFLEHVGLPMPVIGPEQGVVIRAARIDGR